MSAALSQHKSMENRGLVLAVVGLSLQENQLSFLIGDGGIKEMLILMRPNNAGLIKYFLLYFEAELTDDTELV
ncbi:hypothetical protein RvY_03741 [Ramazzottius varieornatus]|uniref:Uncharacterized protein n=1 Tax=Ramazzottius varieornatus TaxID=947166 RepID=A0A1D1UUS8_RAMVA|nr:hypothetical protein RvY_03741 [Ramazzottius varieornatus]